MFHKIISKYKRVYAYLLSSYGKSGFYRFSVVLQIVKNVIKFAVLPITASQLLVAVAGQKFDEAFSFAILFGLGSATIGVLSPLVKYVGMFGENKIYRQETGAYFSRLMSSDVEYFNSNLSGYLTTATRQYVDSGVRLARELRDNYLQVFLAFIVPVIVVFTVNFVLGLIMAALGLVQLGYMLWASYRLEPYRKKSREIYKKHSGIMADAISNILAVKATAREESIVRQVKDNSRREGVAFQKRYSVRAKLTVGREIVTVTTYVTLLLMVITMADMGSLSLAGAILVVTYISPVLTAIYQLAEVLDQHDDLVDQLIPGFELMDQQETVKDPLNPRELNRVKGSVSLENVGFSYNQGDDGRVVFSDLTLCIPAGQKLGVVGVSGAGKSTLTKLLLRFNDVDSGVIRIDEFDIKDVKQVDLRKHIAYVPQEPLLFHDSIKENILFSRPEATDDELNDAIETAHVKQFLSELPEGIDSIVGERGVKLSGGQKQRVAIARAVLQGAPIMILDEATSALDSESEAIIKSSFKRILKGKTAIVVAHRLSTLSDMDRIIVLDRGKIVEDGSHDDLMRLGGKYAKLWGKQQRIIEQR